MKRVVFYLFVFSVLVFQGVSIYRKLKIPLPVHLKPVMFSTLPSWNQANLKPSFEAFLTSCHAFLRQEPNQSVGSQFIPLKARDWYPACHAAEALTQPDSDRIRVFFQTWFQPVSVETNRPVSGLFTGYYLPLLKGSLSKSKDYSVPIYGLPSSIVIAHLKHFSKSFGSKILRGRIQGKEFVPFYTREEIERGAIDAFTPIVAWVQHPLDRLKLEIEGSGVLALDNGHHLLLGYAGENGHAYTSVVSLLINEGVVTHNTASMENIRHYLDEHPDKTKPLLNQNKAFVFFHPLKGEQAKGSQGVSLKPGYSLAIDRKWIPMGMPLWLSTTRPHDTLEKVQPFHRLMIAQDTGGAIRGPVRGDVFWGEGDRATNIAGRMRDKGYYWLLLPKNITVITLAQQDLHRPAMVSSVKMKKHTHVTV